MKETDFNILGNSDVDFSLKGLLGNPVFVCGVLACFLDNTVPGSYLIIHQ